MFSRAAIWDALKFWERARVLFNVILLAYVLFRFGAALSALPHRLWSEVVAVGVFANIVYCAVYPLDLVLQSTSYRHMWCSFGRYAALFFNVSLGIALARVTLTYLLQGA